MDKYSHIALALIFISFLMTTAVFLVIVIAIRGPAFWIAPSINKECTYESSRAIAERFINKSSTFKFDGVEGSITFSGSSEPSDAGSFGFIYTYQTRHAGHGNRAWQTLKQAITDHSVRIVLNNCNVISAVCDDYWDMLTDKQLQSAVSP